MLEQGVNWLEQQLMASCSNLVQYCQQGKEPKQIKAIIGKSEISITDENGFTTSGFMWDFLIDANALNCKPKQGDTIKHKSIVYEVMKMPSGEYYRWTGSNHRTFRVHTKIING